MRRDLYWALVGLCVVCGMFWDHPAPKRAGEGPAAVPRGQVVGENTPAMFSAFQDEGPGPSDLVESGPSLSARRGLGQTLRERLRARREALREWRDRSQEIGQNAPEVSPGPAGERFGELRKRLEDFVQQLRERIQGTSRAPGAEGLGLPEQRMPPILSGVPGPEKPDGSQTVQSGPANQFAPVGPELVIPGTSSSMQPAGSGGSPGLSKAGPSDSGLQRTDKPVAAHPTGHPKQSEPAVAHSEEKEEKAESKSPPQNGLGGWFT
ncbi:MAG: hypothetical protein H5U08_11105, partial [Thermogutta sp.]|uniref:hypothetical protein n=1 Tax=Thermogutta sp. TaxID=1962930 RepID=UPI0019C85417